MKGCSSYLYVDWSLDARIFMHSSLSTFQRPKNWDSTAAKPPTANEKYFAAEREVRTFRPSMLISVSTSDYSEDSVEKFSAASPIRIFVRAAMRGIRHELGKRVILRVIRWVSR